MVKSEAFTPYRTPPLSGHVPDQSLPFRRDGLAISLRHPLAMIEIMTNFKDFRKFTAIIEKEFGLRPERTALGAQHLRLSEISEQAILWQSPYQWLMVSTLPLHATKSWFDDFEAMLPAQSYCVDQSHGRVCIRIEGRYARDLLAMGSHMDCSALGFPVHHCHTTQFFQLSAHIHAIANDCFDIYVPRSFAVHLYESLTHCALYADW